MSAMSTNCFFGGFSDQKDIEREFECTMDNVSCILFADYVQESYEGSATVIYLGADHELYQVYGSHCSCYGLEGQWSPDKVLVDQLKAAKPYQFSVGAEEYYRKIFPYKKFEIS